MIRAIAAIIIPLTLAACSGGDARTSAAPDFETFSPSGEIACRFFVPDTSDTVFTTPAYNPDNHARMVYAGETLTLFSRDSVTSDLAPGTVDFQVEDYPAITILMDIASNTDGILSGTLSMQGADAATSFTGSCK